MKLKVSLAPDVRAEFDRMRRLMVPAKMAATLGVNEYTILNLEFGGMAQPTTVAKVSEAIRRLRGAA